jgi:hypothetical protein
MLALLGTFCRTRNFSLLVILEIEFLRLSNIFLLWNWKIWMVVTAPDATLVYIRGWMQMVFYYCTIWFILLKQIIKMRHWSQLQSMRLYNELLYTTLHTLCMMRSWCCIESVWLSSWLPYGRLVTSAAADWLLILLPTGWARSPLRLPTHGDPISLRVHALLLPRVRYSNIVLSSPLFFGMRWFPGDCSYIFYRNWDLKI